MDKMKYMAGFVSDISANNYVASQEEVECLCDFIIGCMHDIVDYEQRMNNILREALGIEKRERELQHLKDELIKQLS